LCDGGLARGVGNLPPGAGGSLGMGPPIPHPNVSPCDPSHILAGLGKGCERVTEYFYLMAGTVYSGKLFLSSPLRHIPPPSWDGSAPAPAARSGASHTTHPRPHSPSQPRPGGRGVARAAFCSLVLTSVCAECFRAYLCARLACRQHLVRSEAGQLEPRRAPRT